MAEGGSDGDTVDNFNSSDDNCYSLPFDIASVDITYPQLFSFLASETTRQDSSSSAEFGFSLDTDTVDAEAIKGGGFRTKSELYEFKRAQEEERRSDCWSWNAVWEFIKAQVPASKHGDLNSILKKFCETSKVS